MTHIFCLVWGLIIQAFLKPLSDHATDTRNVDDVLFEVMDKDKFRRFGAIYWPLDLDNVDDVQANLETRKFLLAFETPIILANLFLRIDHRLIRTKEQQTTSWLFPSTSKWPSSTLPVMPTLDNNVKLYLGFKGFKISERQTCNQAWRKKMDFGTQHLHPEM